MAKICRYTYSEGDVELTIVARNKKNADEIIAIENTDAFEKWQFTGKEERTNIECNIFEIEENQKKVARRKLEKRRARQA